MAEDRLVPWEEGAEGEVGLPVKGVNIDIKINVVLFPPFYDNLTQWCTMAQMIIFALHVPKNNCSA